MKNILFVASECVPFVKTGGLADVVGSLPKYFNKKEYDVRVMIPKYACIPQEWKDKMQYKTHFYMDLAWRSQYVGILEMEYEGVHFYFIDNEFYFAGFHSIVITASSLPLPLQTGQSTFTRSRCSSPQKKPLPWQ